jgi:glutamine synthetase
MVAMAMAPEGWLGPGGEERRQRARTLAERLQADGISAVALTFVDNAGITRVKTVPIGRLPEVACRGVGMSPVFDHFVVDDSIAPEGSPTGDLRLVPDLDRLTALSAQPGWAWAPVDRYQQDGDPYPGCQRGFAGRQAQRAGDVGLDVRMGFEVEWAVGTEDDDGGFVPACQGPAYGMARLVELSDYVADLHDALAAEGLTVLQIHPEYAPGQFECSVAPADPVAAADAVVLVRETIRALSLAYGMRSSFAPLASAGGVGNGSHLHLSLWRTGRNLFSSGDGRYGLTPEGESFLSAVLSHLPALLGVGAPSAASYLRLVPSHWAGAYRCWGPENREAALRFISGASVDQGQAANAEVKCLDSAANPYLVVGAVLALGLSASGEDGLLPPELTADPALLSGDERDRLGVARLPSNLPVAIEHLAGCEVLATAMGAPLFDALLAVRRAEQARFAEASDSEIVAATRWRY